MQKKGLKLFIYYLLDFFFTTYRKIFSGVLWAKPPNVDVLAYPTRAGHTEKKLLSDIQSGRRFVVHVLYLIVMRHFPRPSFRWGFRLPPFRVFPESR